MIRYPAPLRPGDRIGVTSPSSGVDERFRPRLEFVLADLAQRGYEVTVGECMDGSGIVSAPAEQRAAELTAMLTDPGIGAVVPPWGGELAVDLVERLDYAKIAESGPAWLVGYSDISTLLLAVTTRTGVATLHGQNLMHTPTRRPDGILHYLDALQAEPGEVLEQRGSTHHKGPGFYNIIGQPDLVDPDLDQPGSWRLLDPGAGPVRATGRLIGGCVETIVSLAGTPYGDVRRFAEEHAPEGLIVYVEMCEHAALDAAREMYSLRLAGWFDHANAILVGRTDAPAAGSFTQDDAVRLAFGDLDIPVILDVDCGHVAPELALVNGALAEIVVDGSDQRILQTLS
ncbi:S66 peptidase family protein [Hamadaea sp. NPDC050747]|uniref:S66 family peptidase n=1 Tax=Hamadaea sp. NPDC050747 TaxID=3155789 RepID=UPI00340C41F5